MHLFLYSIAIKRLLIFRQRQLGGDCWAQSLVRDSWFMYTPLSSTCLFINFVPAVHTPAPLINRYIQVGLYFSQPQLRGTVTFVGCLFCWQAPLRNTCSVDKHRWEALILGIGTAEVCFYTVINDKSLILGTGGSKKRFLLIGRCWCSCQIFFEEWPHTNLTKGTLVKNTQTLVLSCPPNSGKLIVPFQITSDEK